MPKSRTSCHLCACVNLALSCSVICRERASRSACFIETHVCLKWKWQSCFLKVMSRLPCILGRLLVERFLQILQCLCLKSVQSKFMWIVFQHFHIKWVIWIMLHSLHTSVICAFFLLGLISGGLCIYGKDFSHRTLRITFRKYTISVVFIRNAKFHGSRIFLFLCSLCPRARSVI